jgi:hypothetical protein
MERLDFTLLADGSSDAILIRPLTWLLEQHLSIPVNGTWADLRRLRTPPKDLSSRIECALDLYPCDLLFVHRDAERVSHEERLGEIESATAVLDAYTVPVVPIRMQEAWLLIDEPALRRAAGNPNGRCTLEVPPIERLEEIPNPKDLLHRLLLDASELTGRRRNKLRPGQMALRLGELIEEYAPLRHLSAFRHAEDATRCALGALKA